MSRYTFFKTLAQCLETYGLHTWSDTHTQKCLKSCMCLGTQFPKPWHRPLNVWSARMARHTYAKMPQILYVSRYTISETLAQCLETYGLQAEPDTYTQKCLKSCMCLGTQFPKPCHSALKRMVCTHGLTHIRKKPSNPVCVSIL